MTTQEFSNMFDTLLNSYSVQAQFGYAKSNGEITLNEYEKSLFLTRAQDMILKSYIDGSLNNSREGFDDSSIRQVDFSNLIKTVRLPVLSHRVEVIRLPSGGLSYDFKGFYNNDAEAIYKKQTLNNVTNKQSVIKNSEVINKHRSSVVILPNNILTTLNERIWYRDISKYQINKNTNAILCSDETASCFIPKDGMYDHESKPLIVIPINYKELDREQSRSYSQPLKNQCWRVNNSSNSINPFAEIVFNSNLYPDNIDKFVGDNNFLNFATFSPIESYYIRYIRQPRPIVLTNLVDDNLYIRYNCGFDILNTQTSELEQNEIETPVVCQTVYNNLTQLSLINYTHLENSVANINTITECELNPIIHMEILEKAVMLALASKSLYANQGQQQQQQQQQSNQQ